MNRRELADWLFGWPLVSALAFFVYGWTLSPAIGWLDSPEFVAAAGGLGVAHSPGHPLPVFLGRILGLLPVGDMVFRANLGSAVAGAAAAAATLLACREALRTAVPDLSPALTRVLSLAGAGLVTFALPVWLQATRAEVYALQAALSAAALWGILSYERKRTASALYLTGFTLGLALATHHFMALLILVPGAAFVFSRRPFPGIKTSAMTAAFGITGLAVFLYLPVRSLAHPVVNWGAPHTLDRFLWTVSTKAFQGTPGREKLTPFAVDLARSVFVTVEALNWPLFLCALFGLYLCVRARVFVRGLLWLGATAALTLLARAWLGFEPDTPDHVGYLVPALLALGILVTVALGQVVVLAAAGPRRSWLALGWGVALLALACAPLQLWRNWDQANLSDGYASAAMADWEFQALPPRSVVLLAYNQTSFRIQALRVVEHARPDIAVVDRSFLTYPGEAEETKRRHPDLAALIDAPLSAGLPTPIDAVRAVARERPLFVQLHPNLDAPTYPFLAPSGAYAIFAADPPTVHLREAAEKVDDKLRSQLVRKMEIAAGTPAPFDLLGAKLNLLWHDAAAATFYCALSRPQAARPALARALALFPDDDTLLDLEQRCLPRR